MIISSLLGQMTNDEILGYCVDKSTPEPQIAKLIRINSNRLSNKNMIIGPLLGSLLRFLASDFNIKNALEIGTFTGYSAAAIATALPKHAKLITLEESKTNVEIAKNNLKDLINLRKVKIINTEGSKWLANYSGQSFELIFVDCRKEVFNHKEDLLINNLSKNGILLIDNAFAKGNVLHPKRDYEISMNNINQRLSHDKNLMVSILPIRDGILIARKVG